MDVDGKVKFIICDKCIRMEHTLRKLTGYKGKLGPQHTGREDHTEECVCDLCKSKFTSKYICRSLTGKSVCITDFLVDAEPTEVPE
jgi:hypothetical protein